VAEDNQNTLGDDVAAADAPEATAELTDAQKRMTMGVRAPLAARLISALVILLVCVFAFGGRAAIAEDVPVNGTERHDAINNAGIKHWFGYAFGKRTKWSEVQKLLKRKYRVLDLDDNGICQDDLTRWRLLYEQTRRVGFLSNLAAFDLNMDAIVEKWELRVWYRKYFRTTQDDNLDGKADRADRHGAHGFTTTEPGEPEAEYVKRRTRYKIFLVDRNKNGHLDFEDYKLFLSPSSIHIKQAKKLELVFMERYNFPPIEPPCVPYNKLEKAFKIYFDEVHFPKLANDKKGRK